MATAYHNLSDYDFNSVPNAENMRFGIVVSEWNSNITDPLLEGAVTTLKKHGAKDENILVKTDDFDTQKGLKGKKAYGTMNIVDKSNGKSTKVYYEVLVFSQNNGLQQITVIHKEDDKYGKEIMDRILNSVELNVAE